MPASKTSEGGGSWYLSDISPADKPWDKHRAESDELARLYEIVGYTRYAERISECSRWLTYVMAAKDDGELKLRLKEARFCRVRHCLVCQWRRQQMWRARLFKALPEIQTKHPTDRWIFVTLTVQNCELTELRATLTWMNAAWGKLMKRKEFPALGFFKSLEVTRNAIDRTAHPHFHCLMLVPAGYFKRGYLSHAKWTELWKSCLKVDYTPIVNVKVVKADKGTLNATLDASNEAMMKAVCETLKYSVKPADLLSDPEWLGELTKQLQKTKAISVGGVLKEFLSENDPEDLINADIEEEENNDKGVEIVFEWASVIKRYAKMNSTKN